jgi:hypothetical protein
MSELALERSLTGESVDAAARLAAEVGLLAGRLARLLEATSVASDTALSTGLDFLRSFAALTPSTPTLSERIAAGAIECDAPLERIACGYGFTAIEVDLLLLAGMAEEHEGFASLFRTLHPRGEPRPTVGLAAQLLCASPRERFVMRELLSTGAAVRAGAVVLGEDGPHGERSLLPGDALWPALAGVEVWPAGVTALTARVIPAAFADWLGSERALHARMLLRAGRPVRLLVVADDTTAATHRALALTVSAGIPAAVVGCAAGVATHVVERLVPLHAVARGVVPIVRLPATPDGTAPEPPFVGDAVTPVILCTREGSAAVRSANAALTLRVDPLTTRARAQLWRRVLPELAAESPLLGACYALEPHAVLDVADRARDRAALAGRAPALADVADCARAHADLDLAPGMRVVHPAASWDQLVLAPERRRLLREALDRLTHQARVLDDWGFLAGRPGARGVRMLFAGPPGTGKTLAAEVLAHTLGVDVLVVDLARLVSKWIGETEKHLAGVFDAAERTRAVLLFDEADALFGRRTEVSDAHDRYANLETAYLLSRLERFDGLTILSTNLRENVDGAFTRRLEFIVDFAEPDEEEREALWRCHLPSTAPLAQDVSLAELAALYPLAGGLIRNAAVAAGFLASASNTDITRHDLVRAVQREYEKMGRAFPGAPAGTFTS